MGEKHLLCNFITGIFLIMNMHFSDFFNESFWYSWYVWRPATFRIEVLWTCGDQDHIFLNRVLIPRYRKFLVATRHVLKVASRDSLFDHQTFCFAMRFSWNAQEVCHQGQHSIPHSKEENLAVLAVYSLSPEMPSIGSRPEGYSGSRSNVKRQRQSYVLRVNSSRCYLQLYFTRRRTLLLYYVYYDSLCT